MDASTNPLIQRFYDLCAAADSRLRDAIVVCEVKCFADGMIAVLSAAPQQSNWIISFMPLIVGLLSRLGHFKGCELRTDKRFLTFTMDDLLMTFPQDENALEIGNDRQSTVEKQAQIDGRYLAALLTYFSQTHHAFVITLGGIYQDVRTHQGSVGTVPADRMIGESISPFIGKAEAAFLLEAMLLAYNAGETHNLEYAVLHPSGEARRYAGTIIPINGTSTCVVLSPRVKLASPRHSLASRE